MRIASSGEAQTIRIGESMALALRPGDLVFLVGDLGAGKSVLARSIIRTLANDEELEVPSPTYTICQTYDVLPPVAHFDLYRLSGMDALDETGWDEMAADGVVLFEWPFNCFDAVPGDAVLVEVEVTGEESRTFSLSGNADLLARIGRSLAIRDFLDANGMATGSRMFLSGDASTRSYEIIRSLSSTRLLMNAPAMPDGPPIRDGKPYSKIAHLAEDVTAFVGVAEILRSAGLKSPEIYAQDHEQGLLLLEHFGNEGIIDQARQPIDERYLACADLLAAFHGKAVKREIELPGGQTYRVPDYDRGAMMIEAELLTQWYLPNEGKPDFDAAEFEAIWQELFDKLDSVPKSLAMRDFHSPNILWLEGRSGTDRLGLIDFQDAVIGPQAYDLASLAQDARVDVSQTLERELVAQYVRARLQADETFDVEGFEMSYAIMAAQRVTKILGIFIRLDVRDGKPQYRQHLPRMLDYLKRSLKHPVLSRYGKWLKSVIEL